MPERKRIAQVEGDPPAASDWPASDWPVNVLYGPDGEVITEFYDREVIAFGFQRSAT